MRRYCPVVLFILLILVFHGCSHFGEPTLETSQQSAMVEGEWCPKDVFDTINLVHLVEGLADINSRNIRGETLLYFAVVVEDTVRFYSGSIAGSERLVYSEHEKRSAVRLLLQHGSDPNLSSATSGGTPLRQAILKGLEHVAEVFLEPEFSDQLETATLMDARTAAQRKNMLGVLRRIDELLYLRRRNNAGTSGSLQNKLS